jgi:hypothetical protein
MWKTFRELYRDAVIPAGFAVFGAIGVWRVARTGAAPLPGLLVVAMFALGCHRLWWRWLGPGRRTPHAR